MWDDVDHDEGDNCELDLDEMVRSRLQQAERQLLRGKPREAEWLLGEALQESSLASEGVRIQWWQAYVECAVRRGAPQAVIQGRVKWLDRISGSP